MKRLFSIAIVLAFFSQIAFAGVASSAIRETAEFIMKKFGRGAPGQTIDEISQSTARAIAKHGDEALPLLRSSGHAGFRALEEAGEKSPVVIKLFAKRGDEAVWIISEPKKLAIFIKHGDTAADALLKHPGIAESLIGRYGGDGVGALNAISRQNAQRLSMLASDGTLDKLGKNAELLTVIRKWGDEGMDFVWKNKGALTVAAVLATFLADADVYIKGGKELVVPIASKVNWTLLIAGVVCVAFLPFIAKSVRKAFGGFKTQGGAK